MFRDYDYLKARLTKIPEVREIYRVSGRSKLDELTQNIRETVFPCIAVDTGIDGVLNLENGFYDKAYHTFHVLFQVSARDADAETVDRITEKARQVGIDVLRMILRDSCELDDPCYGLDAESIDYSCFGPIGMDCYGYTFGYLMKRDHESQ